jgi:drug/metabolite transporter (DMT)-like permease
MAIFQRPDRTLAGILFMCLAGTVFPLMNGFVQVLATDYALEQLVWFRIVGHFVFMYALFAPKFGLGVIRTQRLGLQLARSAALLASTICFFFGIKYLPLAQATAISFTTPFIVVLLAVPFLGERLDFARLLGVAIGFAGVLVVVRPGSDVFQWASIVIVASALFYGSYQIITRKVGTWDRPETSSIYSAVVGSVAMLAVLPFIWKTPASLTDWGLIASLGFLGGLAHYFVAKALTLAPAGVVAPFMYFQIIGSVVVGYALTGKMPDAATWAGALIIVAAGIYVGWIETREKKAGGAS